MTLKKNTLPSNDDACGEIVSVTAMPSASDATDGGAVICCDCGCDGFVAGFGHRHHPDGGGYLGPCLGPDPLNGHHGVCLVALC